MGHNLETRSLLDELKSFDRKGGLFDLGHPLLNRMAECFVKAAGIGAVQAVSKEVYFTVTEGGDSSSIPPELTGSHKKHPFSELRGETSRNSVEALKNSAMAGAITGAALALTFDDSSHEDIVQGAITGAAVSTAANLLTGIF